MAKIESHSDYIYLGYTKNNNPYGMGRKMNRSTGAIYDGLFDNERFIYGRVLELNN